MIQLRRPSLFLGIAYAFLAILTVATSWFATQVPHFGLVLESQRGAPLRLIGGVPGVASPVTIIGFSPPGAVGPEVRVTANDDVIRRVEGELDTNALVTQDRLTALLDRSSVTLWIRDRDGRVRGVTVPQQSAPLSVDLAVLLVIGLIGAAVGLWTIALQPHRKAAWFVGLSGLGLALAAYPVAVIQNGEFIFGGSIWAALMRTNYLASQIFGVSLILLFTHFPRKLLSSAAQIWVGVVGLSVMAVAVFATEMPNGPIFWVNLIVLVDMALIAGCATWQWVASATDLVGRAWLRLVGATSVLSIGSWTALTVGPQLLGETALLSVATGFLLMVPPYIAIVLGLVRGQMFDVDRWATRLLLSAATIVALFASEMALVFVLNLDTGAAASVAFLGVGCVWLLARHQLLDRLFRRNRDTSLDLMIEAHSVIFAPTDAARAGRWRDCLDRTFQPLEIVAGPGGPNRVDDGGLALHVMAPSFAGPLTLKSAKGGRALFSVDDVRLVDQFQMLCDRIEEDRFAYDRGMRAERERIAKDLHDDVSGRLLTGLHRSDPDLVRSDVRNALADIRAIVSGLEGHVMSLSDIVGDVRRETAERLDSVGIALDWPLPATPGRDVTLDYPSYRALGAITRELVTNVIRHSRARRLSLKIDVDGNMLRLIAQDDGIGLDHGVAGRGMRNIDLRAQERGGNAVFTSDAGGTLVKVSLPLMPPGSGDGATGVSVEIGRELDVAK